MADRRLTTVQNVVSEQARKVSRLDALPFTGLIAYNGFGRTHRGETPNDWIGTAHASGPSGIHDFCQRLKSVAEPRLKALAPYLKNNPLHTFVFTGFEGGVPIIGLLSNYESFNGPELSKAASSLNLEIMTPRGDKSWMCLLTGATHITRKRSRDALKDALAAHERSSVVLAKMTKVIRDTAYTDRLRGSVGSSVMSVMLDKFGQSQGGASTIGGGRFVEAPDAFLHGVQFRNIWMTTGPREGSRYNPAKGLFDFVEISCPNCGNPVPEGQKLCASCDHVMPDPTS